MPGRLGGGHVSGHSGVRQSKVRRYQRRVDVRSIIKAYMESPDDVRNNALCRATASKLHTKLKTCPPFVGTVALRHLKTVQNEEHLEHVMDEIWLLAEKHNVLLMA